MTIMEFHPSREGCGEGWGEGSSNLVVRLSLIFDPIDL